jgi:hypothetical protein
MESDNPLQSLSGYELRHVPSHLAATARMDELLNLLKLETYSGHNAWFDAKVDSGQLEAYVTDLAVLQRTVDKVSAPSSEKYGGTGRHVREVFWLFRF